MNEQTQALSRAVHVLLHSCGERRVTCPSAAGSSFLNRRGGLLLNPTCCGTHFPSAADFGIWGGFELDRPRRRNSLTNDPLTSSCLLPRPLTPWGGGQAQWVLCHCEGRCDADGRICRSKLSPPPQRTVFSYQCDFRRTLSDRTRVPLSQEALTCCVGFGSRGLFFGFFFVANLLEFEN